MVRSPGMNGLRIRKKIVPSDTLSLRETFKKTFLPLLTDVFELRQMIENHTMRKSFLFTRRVESPEKVLEKLEQMRCEMEESRRWCNGVILQIARGIEEANKACKPTQKRSLWKRLLRKHP